MPGTYTTVSGYPGGLDRLVDEFRPHLKHGLVQEALAKIGEKYASPQHVGPTHVGDFEYLTDPVERAQIQRDAFEQVQALITSLQNAQK